MMGLKSINSIKKTIISILTGVIFSTTAYAAVLGTPIEESSWDSNLGGGAVYEHNEYSSSSVGKQTENYVEYTPNNEAVPVVINGSSIFGKRTITQAADYMENNSMRPLTGINADYFSLTTGVPMGYTVIDGELFSKEAGIQDAVGFRADGTAFIDKMGITTTVTKDEEGVTVQYINKWPQNDLSWLYLLTDDFGETTHSNFNALYVICSAESGKLNLTDDLNLTVDQTFVYNGAIKIPENSYVFVIDVDGDAEHYSFMSSLEVGDKISVQSSEYGAEKNDWGEVEYAVSTIGGRLLNNSEVGSGFEEGAAPRTAVGIKEDGTVVFYTLDGRQSGYSYGCRISTLAQRMKELGCVDAINMDGGGSTAIGATFAGSDSFAVWNKPSDGSQRYCANYIFLRDFRESTNIPWYIEWQELPENNNYLSGYDVKLNALKIYDTGNYRMDELQNITYTVDNSEGASSVVNDEGKITLLGDGKTTVYVNSDAYSKEFEFNNFTNPDSIIITNESLGDETQKITVNEGEMKTVDLEAAAYLNGVELNSIPSQFTWSVDGTLATVDEDGILSIKDDGSEYATLNVSAGEYVTTIPIEVIKKDSFLDINNHWAHDIIENMSSMGIINGIETPEGNVFKPDSNITRIQFAAIVCKALNIDADSYSSEKMNFTDNASIQQWALNYVKAMTSLGYITGKSDNNGKTSYLDPDSSITRAEAFTILGRTIADESSVILDYSDSNDIPSWAKKSFEKLKARGIISGFEDNSIKPLNLTTRAEAATFISKYIESK